MTSAPARSRRDPIFLIAAFKLFHSVLLLALALGVHHLLRKDVAETVRRWAMALRADPHDRIVEAIVGRVGGLSHEKMEAIGLALGLYAALFAVEGVGLFLRKHWAEWMTVATTALLLEMGRRRHGCDFFAGLFGHRRLQGRYGDALKRLQSRLGKLNDMRAHADRARQVANPARRASGQPQEAFAMGFLTGSETPRGRAILAAAKHAGRDLARLRPFW